MKKLLLILPIISLAVLGCSSHATTIRELLQKVQDKLLSDEQAQMDFIILAKMHCMDIHVNSHHYNDELLADTIYDDGLFRREHSSLFNHLSMIARTTDENKLHDTLHNFEKQHLTPIKGRIDIVGTCHHFYQTHGQALYQDFITNSDNFITQDGDGQVFEEIKLHWLDYLRDGGINVHRLVDACPDDKPSC